MAESSCSVASGGSSAGQSYGPRTSNGPYNSTPVGVGLGVGVAVGTAVAVGDGFGVEVGSGVEVGIGSSATGAVRRSPSCGSPVHATRRTPAKQRRVRTPTTCAPTDLAPTRTTVPDPAAELQCISHSRIECAERDPLTGQKALATITFRDIRIPPSQRVLPSSRSDETDSSSTTYSMRLKEVPTTWLSSPASTFFTTMSTCSQV